MTGEIRVHYLEQFAPAVPDNGWFLLNGFRQCLLHFRRLAVVIENLVLHSPHLPAMGCDATHYSRSRGMAQMCSPAGAGTIAHQRPQECQGAKPTYTHRRYSYRRARKNYLVSQSRHLLPSSRFAESANEMPKAAGFQIVADKGRPSWGGLQTLPRYFGNIIRSTAPRLRLLRALHPIEMKRFIVCRRDSIVLR